MRAPEEVYKTQQQGAPKAAEELSREERTRLRAKKKRAGKKRKQQEVCCAPVQTDICTSGCNLLMHLSVLALPFCKQAVAEMLHCILSGDQLSVCMLSKNASHLCDCDWVLTTCSRCLSMASVSPHNMQHRSINLLCFTLC